MTFFDRTSRGSIPTAFGALVFERARRVALDIDDLKRDIACSKGWMSATQSWHGSHRGADMEPDRWRAFWSTIRSEGAHHNPGLVGLSRGAARTAHRHWNWRARPVSEEPDIVVNPYPTAASVLCRAGHPLARAKGLTVQQIGDYALVAPKASQTRRRVFGGRKKQWEACGEQENTSSRK